MDARYDLLHNAHLKIKGLDELYKVAKVIVFSSFENTHFLPATYLNFVDSNFVANEEAVFRTLGTFFSPLV